MAAMAEELGSRAPGSGLGSAAAELLSRLIAVETVNPPGNEAPAQELLAEELTGAGFACELLAAEPGRPNLIARLEGERPGPALCLLGHVDVVPVDAEDWSFDPFGGERRDGEVRGRGAQDMKGQVAAEVAAATALARSGWRPARGSLLVVTTADEEAGGRKGARWLCENHPDRVRCDWVVNEGGGHSFELGGRRIYTVSVGEKGVFRFNLRTRGRAGHGSQPRIGENALAKLAPLLERASVQPEPSPDADSIAFLEAVLSTDVDEDGVAGALERLTAAERSVAELLAEPMLGITLAPTRVRASEKDNVIPALAEALIDCRVPPGRDEDYVRTRVETAIGPGDYEIEFVERVVGNRSDPAGPLYEALASWLAGAEQGAMLVPIVMPGFSDSHWFRKEIGAVALGFCPQRGMDLGEAQRLIHGADERIRVDDLELAAELFGDLPRRLLG